MRNFLRIRDGDRFWYERHLTEEVTGGILVVIQILFEGKEKV